jgi:hypothetical protein
LFATSPTVPPNDATAPGIFVLVSIFKVVLPFDDSVPEPPCPPQFVHTPSLLQEEGHEGHNLGNIHCLDLISKENII